MKHQPNLSVFLSVCLSVCDTLKGCIQRMGERGQRGREEIKSFVMNELGRRRVGYVYSDLTSYDWPRLLSLPSSYILSYCIARWNSKYLNLEHSVQNISFLNIYENVLHLMNYQHKFHLFSRSRRNNAELGFLQLADIPSVALQF